MISFKDEIKKYGKILEIDEIENAIHQTELKDIMDMLSYISKNNNKTENNQNENNR